MPYLKYRVSLINDILAVQRDPGGLASAQHAPGVNTVSPASSPPDTLSSLVIGEGFKTGVEGADQRGFVVRGVLDEGVPLAHRHEEPQRKGTTEEEVDEGVGAAVETGQQHQDGEGGSCSDSGSQH